MIIRVLLPLILTTWFTSGYVLAGVSQLSGAIAPKSKSLVSPTLPVKPKVVQPKWQIYKSPDGWFSILMPGIPQSRSQVQKTSMGEITLNELLVQPPQQEVAYVVTYNEFPYDYARMTNPQKILDQAQSLALQTTRSNLVSQRNIRSSNGHPGKEIKYINAVGKLTTNRMYVADGRLYQVMAIVSKKQRQSLSKTITGYLNSFQLVLKR
jgi:hypothetical protein